MAKNKYALSDELWGKIQACLPERNNTHPRGGGRKPKDDRLVFEAILFVLRFGCQWNALNSTGLCPSSTVHDRFQKWLEMGVFHRLSEEGLLAEEPLGGIDWSWLAPAGGVTRPPLGRVPRGKSIRSRERRQTLLGQMRPDYPRSGN